MSDGMIKAVGAYCDQQGDKLIELMERCNVVNLPSVPEEEAALFLSELKGENN